MSKQVRLFCKCGGEWKATIPETAAERITKLFWDSHKSPQCGETSQEECRRTRYIKQRYERQKEEPA